MLGNRTDAKLESLAAKLLGDTGAITNNVATLVETSDRYVPSMNPVQQVMQGDFVLEWGWREYIDHIEPFVER